MKPGKIHPIITEPALWSKYTKTDNNSHSTNDTNFDKDSSPSHSPSSLCEENMKEFPMPIKQQHYQKNQLQQFGFLLGGTPTPLNTPTENLAFDGSLYITANEPSLSLSSSLKKRRATEPAILEQKRFKSNSVAGENFMNLSEVSSTDLNNRQFLTESQKESMDHNELSLRKILERKMDLFWDRFETCHTRVSRLEELITLMEEMMQTFLQKEKMRIGDRQDQELEVAEENSETIDSIQEKIEFQKLAEKANLLKKTFSKAFDDIAILLEGPK
ncbi:uncharacterized protein SAPINGB_P001060 [Magnusiomyces paraingens]|uniref:Uncharacterized protein n=1 Tax=Magnusiomyces paraingens TaxID=2606893 RepID=A0A5E8B3T0_9ASCO|nr:uncharacterized protein SAPINGB_P001060 [Saprochaete ingens]VVT46128.1 unnamed protein product [Saprochaete ingens]